PRIPPSRRRDGPWSGRGVGHGLARIRPPRFARPGVQSVPRTASFGPAQLRAARPDRAVPARAAAGFAGGREFDRCDLPRRPLARGRGAGRGGRRGVSRAAAGRESDRGGAGAVQRILLVRHLLSVAALAPHDAARRRPAGAHGPQPAADLRGVYRAQGRQTALAATAPAAPLAIPAAAADGAVVRAVSAFEGVQAVAGGARRGGAGCVTRSAARLG